MRFERVAADMGGEHNVGERGQRVRRVRFLLEDIKAGAGDGLTSERRDEGFLVNYRAAGDVDDISVRAKAPQDIGVDDMLGLGP